MLKLILSEDDCVLQARRIVAEEKLEMAIKEKEMKIRDFQESNLRKARQVSAVQAALNRKERECCALQERKEDELKALKVLLAEKEQENTELKARFQK